ncbi:dihydrolipoyl dehydrogenase family protein [Fodinibius salsisoli]|uniref:NAD(P)/FAD-dependent oxidoreductase n=1 Tax=Fodinibius salsisoli TaxID=2820877 RepID=A0ABT3PKG9_9BACT|nr:NAD(P)/FAD-dependent oxidoreductase [Fodinibius salsisoli]MCW9706253.1 NAD(P)/FAD-dependent oxidoreductase [Fodinibius salsisoli]
MAKQFDLIVIGTGSGGSTAAGKCAKAGWEVAQIDSRPFGGTCALRGCDPKKVLVGAAELIDWNRRMNRTGVPTDTHIDWQQLMQFKESFTQPVPEHREKGMHKVGITPIHGRASFVDEGTIEVNGEILKANNFLIAAGAKPAPLPIDGFEHLTTSTEFLELEELPGTIVFVGGGFISFEFAHIATRAGSKVHIVHRGERPLEGFDGDLVDILLEKTEKLGISAHLGAEVQSVQKDGQDFTVKASQNGKTRSISGDLVIHGAGRVPDIDDMDLEKGNVERGKRGITVNEYLQSPSNPNVYAAGDAADTDGLPLTPVAGFESHIVASNLLEGNNKKAEYPAQPTVVFTVPSLAMVGLTERQARDEGYDIEVTFKKTDEWYSYQRTNESPAAFKTIINNENGQMLGAHVLGSKSEEIINLFAMAINQNLRATALKKMVYGYPSHASDIPYMV